MDAGHIDDTSMPVPEAGGVPQRNGVIYEGVLWTPSNSTSPVTVGTCTIRPSLVGCEMFPHPRVGAIAIDGQRIVVLMARGLPTEIPDWDLLVSDDLGATVRRFSLAGVTGNAREAGLYLFRGRIFLLSPQTDPIFFTVGGARIFEVDPNDGAIFARGGDSAMSSVFAVAGSEGVLTTVDFVRDRPPQVIGITRFAPATNSVTASQITCDVPGCDSVSFARPFLSADAETFTLVRSPVVNGAPDPNGCLLTVGVSARSLASECIPGLSTDITPISSFGGTPYDFGFTAVDAGQPFSIVALDRLWIPSGTPLALGTDQAHWMGGGFFTFSPSAFATEGDALVLRLTAGGQLQTVGLPHDGCWNVTPFRYPGGCTTKVVAIRPTDGGEIIVITQRDEFQEPARSRQLFELFLVKPTFEFFQP